MKSRSYFGLSKKVCAALLLLPLMGWAIVIKSVRSKPKNRVIPIRVSPPNGGASETPQVIEMLNGDSLSGTMLGYDPGTGVAWKNDAALGEIIFKTPSIARVKLQHALPPGVSPQRPSRLHFRNGDELIGELMMINQSNISLNTWYGGVLNIPRNAVTHITPGGVTTSAIYDGPRDMSGWSGTGLRNGEGMRIEDRGMRPQKAANNGNNGWIFRNQAFYSMGSGPHIGRKVKFPDMVNLEFDLTWRGHFQLSTYFYTDKMQPYSGNAYNLTISSSNVYLQRMTSEGSANIGNVNLSLKGKSKGHFSICVNRKTRTVTLLIDGEVKRQWEDGLDFAGKGDGLMFVNQGSGGLKLSGIRVSEWDGNLPAAVGGRSSRANKDELRLAGNNVLSGVLRWVRDGKVEFFFEGTGTEQKIPLERVERIRFAAKTTVAPQPLKPLPGTVRATFVDGGRMTFKMDEWVNDQVVGESDVLDKVDFRSAVFKVLDFNIDKQRSTDDDPFGF